MRKLLFALMLLLAAPAWATVRYVDGTCADCNNYKPATRVCEAGGTATNYDTVVEGVSATAAGDTLYIRAGTYEEYLASFASWWGGATTFAVGTDYTTGAVNISAYAAEVVTIRGIFIRGSDYNSGTIPKYHIWTNIIVDSEKTDPSNDAMSIWSNDDTAAALNAS